MVCELFEFMTDLDISKLWAVSEKGQEQLRSGSWGPNFVSTFHLAFPCGRILEVE